MTNLFFYPYSKGELYFTFPCINGDIQKPIRSEYLGTLQLADILTFMWIASKIDILLYSQTYEKKHF